tara:strand:+ start:230 stop:1309 length:1080 start_codon:yes stop_codon:yes gene_type:complete
MVSTELHNIITPILAGCVTILILLRSFLNFKNEKGTFKDFAWWDLGNVVVLVGVIIATSTLEYKMKIIAYMISITWFGSTIIQQLVSVTASSASSGGEGNCDWSDVLTGNLMLKKGKIDDTEISRLLFVGLYLFLVLMLMIILLFKVDSQAQILTSMNDNIKYIFIILLPMIVVFVNEAPVMLNLYNNSYDKDKYMTSDLLFKRFVTGNYEYETNDKSYISKIIFTCLFLVSLFILFINYSTGGNISMFSDRFGVGNSNIPVYIVLFILMFFNFIVETLFMQKCAFETKTTNDYSKENKTFGCRISKYGGLSALLFISYTVAVLYQINGTKDKMYALLFIIALTFGFSELFISLKNKKS